METEYYQAVVDIWRLFKNMLTDENAFSETWWKKWVTETNRIGMRHPGRFAIDLICVFTSELERISRR